MMHVYEVRPRKDKRGVDLISDALPFGALWYSGPEAVSNAIGYAEHYSRSHRAVNRVLEDPDSTDDSDPTSMRRAVLSPFELVLEMEVELA